MNNVQVREFNGEIVAKIPHEWGQEASDLKIGIYDKRPKWKCWRFRKSPATAAMILQAFSGRISHCDETVKNLGWQYREALDNKYNEQLPGIPNMKTAAWNHQCQAYWFCTLLPGAVLSMDMGTGKSLVAVGLLSNRDNDKTLLICPKSVIPVWPEELKHSTINFMPVPLVKGSVADRQRKAAESLELARLKKQPCVIIINYESFWRDVFLRWAKRIEWDHIIFDECHRLKEHSGVTSRSAAQLNATYKVGLTGTVMPHSPMDPFAQFRAIDPSIFGLNYYVYQTRYAEMGGFGGKQVVAFKNQEELAKKIDSISYRARADQVLDLPEATHMRRYVDLEAKTARHYRELDNQLFTEIENGEVTPANAMVKVLRLQQLTSGYLKTDDGDLIECGTEKKKLLKDILQDIPPEEPVVVFARFTADIQNIKEACKNEKRTCAELSGNANQLKEWQDGKFNSIAVQIRSGGVGISLVRSCYCIYFSIGHSLGDYVQSLARTNRPGQTRPVRYYHLLAKGTIDEQVYRALEARKKIADYIVNYYVNRKVSQVGETLREN